MNRALYPRNPELHYQPKGDLFVINDLSPKELLEFYEIWFSATNALIIALGGIQPNRLVESVRQSEFNDKYKFFRPKRKAIWPSLVRDELESQKTALNIYFPRPLDEAEDISIRMAMDLIASAPFGLLHKKLRQEKGLVYSIDPYYDPFPTPRLGFSFSGNENAFVFFEEEVSQAIDQVVEGKYPVKGFKYLVAQMKVFLNTLVEKFTLTEWSSFLKSMWLKDEFRDLETLEIVERLKPEDVSVSAKEYLKQHGLIIFKPEKKQKD